MNTHQRAPTADKAPKNQVGKTRIIPQPPQCLLNELILEMNLKVGLKIWDYSQSTVFGSGALENLLLKGRNASSRKYNNDPVELELRLPPGHLGLFIPLIHKQSK